MNLHTSFNSLIPQNMPQVDPVPVDTMAPLSWFSKNGYYVVDNKIFRHKVYAMQEATRKNLGPKDVTWVFNNNEYDSMDWLTPSTISLQEIYRQRAQQLRDKYDYLILSFSGGGDSTNVLHSFLLNNIHLDEIVVGWARSQTAGKYQPSLSSDSKNYLSEWDYLVEPTLKWVEKISPRTRITVVDPYDQINPQEPEEDLVETTARHNLIGRMRYKAIDNLLLERQTKYKNCAIIMGVNPPNLCRLQRHVMVYLFDPVTSMYASDYTAQGLERNVEFFYWTPDMPEMFKTQAHVLLNALKANPECVDLLPIWRNDRIEKNKLTGEPMRRWVKKILYPTYDYTSLQIDKNTSPLLVPEWFSWFYDNPHSRDIMQPHVSAVRSYHNVIDPRFFVVRDGEVHDYYCYYSRLFHIGDLT